MVGMLILRLCSQGAVFLTTILLSKLLGPEQFGAYSYIFYGFLLFFTVFNVAGLNDILVREMAGDPARRELIYRCGLALKMIASLTGYVLVGIVILIGNPLSVSRGVGLLAATTLFFSFSMGSFRLVWDVPYQVDFRMISTSVVNLFSKSLFLLLVIWWAWQHNLNGQSTGFLAQIELSTAVITIVVFHILAEVSGFIVQGGLNLRFGYPLRPKWVSEMIRFLIREVWSLAIAGGLLVMLSRINLLLLPLFVGERELGLYAVPMRLIEATYIVPTVFIATLLPILSRTFRQHQIDFLKLVKLSYKLMTACAVLMAVLVQTYSVELLELIYQGKYEASAPVMALFSWVAVVAFGMFIFNTVVIASGQQKHLIWLYGMQILVALAANLLLIPRFGIMGATAAFLITYLALFLGSLLFRDIRTIGLIWIKIAPLPILSALVISYGASYLNLAFLPGMFLTPLLTLGVLFLTGWLRPGDLQDFRRFLRER